MVLFGHHELEVPVALTKWKNNIVFALPFRHETVLLVEPYGCVSSVRDMMQTREKERTQVLSFTDVISSNVDSSIRVKEDDAIVTILLDTAFGQKRETAVLPFSLDESWCAELDPLEKVESELLLGNSGVTIAVDGKVAENKDVMRALVGLGLQSPIQILVLGDTTAVRAPYLTVLRAAPALARDIVQKAAAVFVPQRGGAHCFSQSEALQLGARVVAVDDRLAVHGLDDLISLPVSRVQMPKTLDHEHFWSQIFSSLPPLPQSSVSARPRIALVTPMFPQLGGPPHSSLDLALALTEITVLDIWTDGDMLSVHRAKVNAVYRLDSEFDARKYDGIIYVLGNHPMYARIFDLMLEHGGALILHDAHMLDFLAVKYGKEKLAEFLLDEYGKPINTDDHGSIVSDLASYGRPFLKEVVRYANPTIVHSPTSATVLRSLYGVNAQYFPVGMPYPFKREELTFESRTQAKLTLGISPARVCIASFGEVQMLKGAKQCLFALKELAEWGVDFQFLFVGPVDDALRNELNDRIRQYRLQDHVVIKGVVSEDDYIQYLKAVDIVLQIRQIPFGQVSGALLDAVSAGMHGVSSENLAVSIGAPELIRRVDDKSSPTLYAAELARLIESKAYQVRPGPGWENFIVEHDFVRYARNLVSLLFKPQN